MEEKEVEFIGHSLDAIKEVSESARRRLGQQLGRVQSGFEPTDWKPINTVGRGVKEIRVSVGGQYRLVYVVRERVYVLHVFRKKSETISKKDMEIIKSAYKEMNA